MTHSKRNVALIVAAGSGSRAGGGIAKQFRNIRGKPMLLHSYEAFQQHPKIAGIFIVVGEDQLSQASNILCASVLPSVIIGGMTRRESVANGLAAIAAAGGAKNVLIHDAARPFLSQRIITDLIDALSDNSAAVPALPVVDSLARGDMWMAEAIDRAQLHRIQTPQAFRFEEISLAHRNWESGAEATDDARIATSAGINVAMISGDEQLAKFTFADDFTGELGQSAKMQSFRTGTGFDVHRLLAGKELWLCGIKIEHDFGLLGHSDADVALHAITDAMLGALALGDIGDHFPPSDPKWRGASSDQFAIHALNLATDKGYAIGNVDVTIMCEAPKIGPHRAAMRARIAEILSTDVENISVKATTTERLGFTGRGEGIAAQAVVSLYRQD
jgi:2-C-methyl-D-erythritol 4-phosphate cytidylyltransferase / 2-C-methyl-D-erythritol 2,4-cyclodiphosphate synthase